MYAPYDDQAHSVPVVGVPGLVGRVFIVAGRSDTFAEVARLLAAEDALVAVVSTDAIGPEVAAHFRADHADAAVWERVVPHVEQRLGPIDAVVTDAAGRSSAERLVGPDLQRRGHGSVLVLDGDADADAVVRTLAGRR
jgi:hypothetical protein